MKATRGQGLFFGLPVATSGALAALSSAKRMSPAVYNPKNIWANNKRVVSKGLRKVSVKYLGKLAVSDSQKHKNDQRLHKGVDP